MTTKGIDVSKHQGTIDFNKVKNSGIDFVIIRAGYGMYSKQKDPKFEENYSNAKAAGIPVGAYWYSYATTVSEAEKEADVCLEVIKGKQFEYPIWFDQEYETSIKALSDSTRTSIVKAFCNKLEKAGYYTGIYCSRDWLQNYLISSQLTNYDVWIAAYGSSAGNVPLPYGIWQYSSTGKVSGISGNVDLDYSYKDYPTIIKNAGLNGYSSSSSTSSSTSSDNEQPSAKLYNLNISEMSSGDASKFVDLGNTLGISVTYTCKIKTSEMTIGDVNKFVDLGKSLGIDVSYSEK